MGFRRGIHIFVFSPCGTKGKGALAASAARAGSVQTCGNVKEIINETQYEETFGDTVLGGGRSVYYGDGAGVGAGRGL